MDSYPYSVLIIDRRNVWGTVATVEAYLRQMTLEADDVISLTFAAVDGSELPAWRAGAHIGIELPTGIRHYSLCGAMSDRYNYVVAVLREEASRGGSSFVHDSLRLGNIVDIHPPSNHFELEEAPSYRFIAGGIGVTPIKAMIADAETRGVPWTMLYIGRSRWTMAYLDELIAHGDRVELVPRDEKPRPDLGLFLREPLPGELVYVCGPPVLVDAVGAAAIAQGFDADAVRSERFVPVEIDDADALPFDVECAGSGLRAVVPASRSLVEVLEDNGIDIESACREGICGTCRVPVVSGSLVHRDAVLSDAERATGSALMACVSRATGRLVLEL